MTTSGPLSLLTWEEKTRKFVLNPNTLNLIRKLSSPLAIVSIAGLYRTGKSYLMNRVFLNRSEAFEVGPSINPCTKGIWIWGEPLNGTLEDGTPCSVLLIDTEGMGGLEKDNDYDCRIFSIAALISSCFIYNSTGSIDETAIENLSLIVNISKLIQANDPTSFFPRFMWILRDFTLQLVENDGKSIEPNEYLEKALAPQKGFSDTTENKNRIRNTLKAFFKDRECVTLVRPTIDEKDLQSLESLEMDQLRSEFVQQVIDLRKRVIFSARAKRVNGQNINGELLIKLLENYVDSFNSGTIPNIDLAWNYICKAQNRKSLDKALEEYNNNMIDIGLPIEEQELALAHKESKNLGMKYLQKNTVGGDSDLFTEFKERIREKYEEQKLQNKYQLKLHYMTHLKEQYTELDSAIKSGEFTSMQAFEKTIKIVEKDYLENTIDGQLKGEIFLTFAREISNKAADFLISGLGNELKMQKTFNSDQNAKMAQELKETREELGSCKGEYEKTIGKIQNELTVVLAKEGVLREQLTKAITAKEELENIVKDLNKQKFIECEDYAKKLVEFEDTIKELNRKHTFQLSEVEDSKALLQQKLNFTEHSLEEYKSKDKNYSEKLKEYRLENSQAQKALQTKYDQQIEKINERLSEKIKENAELENEVELKEALLEEVQALLNETKAELANYKGKTESELENLKREIMEKDAIHIKKIEKMEQEYKTSTARIRARLSETEKKLRNSEELLRNDMAIWAQDNAILVQKIEFLEQEVEEQKIKREEEKRHYENFLSKMHSENND